VVLRQVSFFYMMMFDPSLSSSRLPTDPNIGVYPTENPRQTPNQAPVITPSRIISSGGGVAAPPTRKSSISANNDVKFNTPVLSPSLGRSRPPTVTPSRIIEDSPPPPADPMSEDENTSDHRSAEAEEYSVYGSMDGFVQPPPRPECLRT
jgi:hypothetical protein